MTSNYNVMDRPSPLMTSANTARREGTGLVGIRARSTGAVLQVPVRTWYPVEVAIAADAAVAAVRATWRHRQGLSS